MLGFLARLFCRRIRSKLLSLDLSGGRSYSFQEEILESYKIERLKAIAQASLRLREMLSEGKENISSQEEDGG